MEVGVPDQAIKDAQGGLGEEINVTSLGLGETIQVRVVAGVRVANRAWLPYKSKDDEGRTVTGWQILNADSRSILGTLADHDIRIQCENTGRSPKDCPSRLSPQKSWLYAVLDRRETEPRVKKLVANYTVFKGLSAIQQEIREDDPSKLTNGLLFMVDAYITKKLKDSKRPAGRNNTEYVVKPMYADKNPFAGKISRAAGDPSSKEFKAIASNLVRLGVYTREEAQVIADCKLDLVAETSVMSDDQILSALREKPLWLAALNKDRVPLFMYPEELAAKCDELGVPYIWKTERVVSPTSRVSDSRQSAPVAVDATPSKSDVVESSSDDEEMISIEDLISQTSDE